MKTNSIRTRITTMLLAAVLVMTSVVSLTTTEASAASVPKAPGKVTLSSAVANSQNQITIKWKKVKGAKGYQIQRKAGSGAWTNLTTIKKNGTVSYVNKGLKAGTKYSYRVRAYKTYKQKQYYNSKTKKWVTKKPSKKQWVDKKTRNVTKYKYGKWSVVKAATTKKAKTNTSQASNSSSNSNTSSMTCLQWSTTGFDVGEDCFKVVFDLYNDGQTVYVGMVDGRPKYKYEVTTNLSVTSSKHIDWDISNQSIAMIEVKQYENTDVAKISFMAPGEVTITATEDGTGNKKSITFTVINELPINAYK